MNRLSLGLLEVKSFVTKVNPLKVSGGLVSDQPPAQMATCQTLIKTDRCCVLASEVESEGGTP